MHPVAPASPPPATNVPDDILSDGDVDLALPDGDRLEKATVRASWRTLTNASRYWDAMHRAPMLEARTRHLVETFPVALDTWRRLIRDLHEEDTMRPRLDEAIGLHALVDYLMPKATRTGKALCELGAACLHLLKTVPPDKLAARFDEATGWGDEQAMDLLARRLFARPLMDNPGFLELSTEAFQALMERAATRPNSERIACIQAWCQANSEDGDIAAMAAELNLLALPNSGFSVQRWRDAGLLPPDGTVPTPAEAFAPDAWQPLTCGKIFPAPTGVWSVQPIGQYILVGALHQIVMLDAATGSVHSTLDRDCLHAAVRGNEQYVLRSAANHVQVFSVPDLLPLPKLAVRDRCGGEAVLSDGLIAVGDGHGVALWDGQTLEERRYLYDGDKDVRGLCLDARNLLTSEYRGHVDLWDLQARRVLHRFNVQRPHYACHAVLTEHHVVAHSEHLIYIWDRHTYALLHTLHADGPVTALAAQDDVVLSACNGGVDVWHAITGAKLQTLRGHTQNINTIATHNGTVLTAGWDKTIRVWYKQPLEAE